jgi:hypothetical protein
MSQGWIPNFITAPDDQAMGSEVFQLGKRLEQQVYAERLICSRPIPESEFLRIEEALQDEESLTPDEFLSYQRMKLEIFYCRQVDLQMITDDNRWKLRRQFAAYNRLMDRKSISDFEYEYNLLPVDRLRKNLTVLADERAVPYLLRGILSSTPIFSNNEFVTDVEFTGADLSKFTRICLNLKNLIERQMDIFIRADVEAKPVTQLGVFLSLIGIKTMKTRTVKTSSGGKNYFYKIDPESVKRMTNLIELEEQRKDPWGAINARHGFKSDQNQG